MSTSEPAGGQYLTFVMGGEAYAIGILDVREIIQHEGLTRVPKTPAWVRGVINLRGSVVPVIDLAAKFGRGESPIMASTCIVITEMHLDGEATVMGILADAVSQVIDMKPEDVLPPPSFGTRISVEYLRGVGTLADGAFALILDLEKVLSVDELQEAQSLSEDEDHVPAPAEPAENATA